MWRRHHAYLSSFRSIRKSDKILISVGCLIITLLVYMSKTKNFSILAPFVFDRDRSYLNSPSLDQLFTVTYNYTLHAEELEFPLAYSLLIYTDANRAIRLLRAIYRPHNHYCIHIDRKSGQDFVHIIRHAIEPFDKFRNVYLLSETERVNVDWGFIGVLDAELICAATLLKAGRQWKYWINLTGHEFPLRTNWELVVALKALNGGNIVEAKYKNRIMSRLPPKSYVSFKFTWYKGSVHLAVRREFVDYMLSHPRAKELYAALQRHELQSGKGVFPEETFFPTLNHNPDQFPIPGAFTGEHEEHVADVLTRAKVWSDSGLPCGSRYWRHQICIYGLADLAYLLRQPHLFANKFMPSVEPLAYNLLELWLAAKIQNETLHHRLSDSFNVSYYSMHPYATQHV